MAGTLTIDTLKASSGVLATQNGMTGIAKAWVNYNSSSQVINSSFNVSSITYVSTGTWTVNFATAFSDANYAVAGLSSGGNVAMSTSGTPTASSCTMFVWYPTNNAYSSAFQTAVFFHS